MINIGLLGFGTVGSAVFTILEERKAELETCLRQKIRVKRVLVRNLAKYEDTTAFPLMTTEIAEIITDPEINVLIELTGNVAEMIEPLRRSLSAGRHLVTANKALLSKYLEELTDLAVKHGVAFRYEASVAGAIPIIILMKNISTLNEVLEIEGVLNGTCNYLLSRMESGLDYATALAEAQALGFSEADPSSDVEGYDTMYKLRILSSLAFKQPVLESDISCTGITGVTKTEIEQALAQGQRIKLVAKAARDEKGEIVATVRPTAVGRDQLLGSLNNGENAIILRTSNAGTLTFSGLGAGGRPTAFSVLSDLMQIYGAQNR